MSTPTAASCHHTDGKLVMLLAIELVSKFTYIELQD